MYVKRKKIHAIVKSLRSGSSIYNACKAADIDTSTLWGWRKLNNRLNLLVTGVIESRIQNVEDSLYKNAIEGNVAAQIFFLKNRGDWHDTPLIDQSQHQIINVQIEKYENQEEIQTARIAMAGV